MLIFDERTSVNEWVNKGTKEQAPIAHMFARTHFNSCLRFLLFSAFRPFQDVQIQVLAQRFLWVQVTCHAHPEILAFSFSLQIRESTASATRIFPAQLKWKRRSSCLSFSVLLSSDSACGLVRWVSSYFRLVLSHRYSQRKRFALLTLNCVFGIEGLFEKRRAARQGDVDDNWWENVDLAIRSYLPSNTFFPVLWSKILSCLSWCSQKTFCQYYK